MTLSGFLAYSTALAIAAAIPGPGVTALVARALGTDLRASLAMSLGLVVGDVCYLTAVVLGLQVIAQSFGTVFLLIKWLGVGYLLYLAWALWTSPVSAAAIQAPPSRGSLLSSFLSGLSVTLGNPKTMIFYLALVPTLVDLHSITLTDYATLAVATMLILSAVLLPYLVLATKARWLLQTPRALKALNRSAATCMVGAALAIATRNTQKIT